MNSLRSAVQQLLEKQRDPASELMPTPTPFMENEAPSSSWTAKLHHLYRHQRSAVLGFAFVMLAVTGVAATVALTQISQDVRQQASEGVYTVAVNCSDLPTAQERLRCSQTLASSDTTVSTLNDCQGSYCSCNGGVPHGALNCSGSRSVVRCEYGQNVPVATCDDSQQCSPGIGCVPREARDCGAADNGKRVCGSSTTSRLCVDGSYQDQTCSQGCNPSSGRCVEQEVAMASQTSTACKAGEKLCDGNTVLTCQADGSKKSTDFCTNGTECSAGKCVSTAAKAAADAKAAQIEADRVALARSIEADEAADKVALQQKKAVDAKAAQEAAVAKCSENSTRGTTGATSFEMCQSGVWKKLDCGPNRTFQDGRCATVATPKSVSPTTRCSENEVVKGDECVPKTVTPSAQTVPIWTANPLTVSPGVQEIQNVRIAEGALPAAATCTEATCSCSTNNATLFKGEKCPTLMQFVGDNYIDPVPLCSTVGGPKQSGTCNCGGAIVASNGTCDASRAAYRVMNEGSIMTEGQTDTAVNALRTTTPATVAVAPDVTDVSETVSMIVAQQPGAVPAPEPKAVGTPDAPKSPTQGTVAFNPFATVNAAVKSVGQAIGIVPKIDVQPALTSLSTAISSVISFENGVIVTNNTSKASKAPAGLFSTTQTYARVITNNDSSKILFQDPALANKTLIGKDGSTVVFNDLGYAYISLDSPGQIDTVYSVAVPTGMGGTTLDKAKALVETDPSLAHLSQNQDEVYQISSNLKVISTDNKGNQLLGLDKAAVASVPSQSVVTPGIITTVQNVLTGKANSGQKDLLSAGSVEQAIITGITNLPIVGATVQKNYAAAEAKKAEAAFTAASAKKDAVTTWDEATRAYKDIVAAAKVVHEACSNIEAIGVDSNDYVPCRPDVVSTIELPPTFRSFSDEYPIRVSEGSSCVSHSSNLNTCLCSVTDSVGSIEEKTINVGDACAYKVPNAVATDVFRSIDATPAVETTSAPTFSETNGSGCRLDLSAGAFVCRKDCTEFNCAEYVPTTQAQLDTLQAPGSTAKVVFENE